MDKDSNKKNIVQDIMPKKRSIRDVELPSRTYSKNDVVLNDINPKNSHSKTDPFEKKVPINKLVEKKEEVENNLDQKIPSYRYDYDEPKHKSRNFFYISLVILVLAIGFGVSALFKGAKITINPRNEIYTLTPTNIFSAKKDGTGSNLGFQVVTISKDLEKSVVSDGEQSVSKKAQGTIVIYNNTTQAQKLIATTRFETPEGLVYRLIDPITVPANQTKNGKIIPGSVEVKVAADQPGEKYNIGLTDFTIPGLKGSSKYTSIYAKSKTEMTGGFVGVQKVVSSEIISSTDSELKNQLKEALVNDIILQIPDNFILFDNTITYEYLPISEPVSKGESAILQKKAVARAIIFDKGALSRSIVSKILPKVENDIIKIKNLESLSFSFKEGVLPDLKNVQNIEFSLSGDAQFVWVFDENKLKTELLGLSVKQAKTIISNYNSILEVWIETSPFWNQKIPEDLSKIKIINKLNQ